MHKKRRWVTGTISHVHSPVSYIVQLIDGSEWRRHVDQLRDNGSNSSDLVPPLTEDNVLVPTFPAYEPTVQHPPECPREPPHRNPLRNPLRNRRPPSDMDIDLTGGDVVYCY